MKTKYYISSFFPEEFQKLVRRKQDFEYVRTSYTKKLKTKHCSIIFNPDGVGDDRILSLINKVRNDAKKYLNENKIENQERIFFSQTFEIPESEEILMKVDLSSAYWNQGVMDGIISKETNEYFEETFGDRTGKEKKSIRLKALGSTATRKEIETFEKGESVNWEVVTEDTKEIYMSICRKIDQAMRECRLKVDGCIFYYWDCMFVRKKFAREVVEFFKKKQFECKMEETRLIYETIGTKAYFISEVDNKMYLVEAENKNLLNTIIQ